MWLNYIEINVRRKLKMYNNIMHFRDVTNINTEIARFEVIDALGVTIWDVSDPTNIFELTTSLEGNTLIFNDSINQINEYVAFNSSAYLTPVIKGSIVNLTRQMASYYGQYNIRVNTLVSGGLAGHVAGKSDTQNPIFVEQYSKKTPLKYLGRPEEIASTALFLASDAASYITGATIMVDGGWTII